MVWHHRRDSMKAYLKQQLNYGHAEALLEIKWPEKYNLFGHLDWQGRMYGPSHRPLLPFLKQRVYYGVWGSRLFQPKVEETPSTLQWLPVMPEWYLILLCLAGLSALGVLWQPLLLFLPLFAAGIAIPTIQTAWHVAQIVLSKASCSRFERFKQYGVTTILFGIQPLVRLIGRLQHGLAPWRRQTAPFFAFPRPRRSAIWSERWQSAEQWLTTIEKELSCQGAVVARGGEFDRWDLEVRGGLFGTVRIHMAIEEHGAGRQMVRLRSWSRFTPLGLAVIFVTVVLLALALLAAFDRAWLPAVVIGLTAVLLALRAAMDCAAAAGSTLLTLRTFGDCAAVRPSALQALKYKETRGSGG